MTSKALTVPPPLPIAGHGGHGERSLGRVGSKALEATAARDLRGLWRRLFHRGFRGTQLPSGDSMDFIVI